MSQPASTRPTRPFVSRYLGRSTLLRLLGFLVLGILAWGTPHAAATIPHHALRVTLEPDRGWIAVEDQLTLPPGQAGWTFSLHADMTPRVTSGNATLIALGRQSHLERYRLVLHETSAPVDLSYAGKIHHELDPVQESLGRRREWTQGIISREGVFLDAASAWYPRFEEQLLTFDLTIVLPAGWLAVSQGAGPNAHPSEQGVSVRWREAEPQDDIYLMAGAFRFYEQATPIASAQVYLRKHDEALANRYLEATARYLELYTRLIGPYPYAKFALVENFWATGYGMPSFTVLGSEVIRLPFIPLTSYPHEVLHNWWGNGVYVDYATGNWSEGLTSYLADHLLKEETGQGAAYRRETLQSYANYVQAERDFPLTAFRGRHTTASQAVGYGRTLMLFHMLRRDLGDRVFVEGLRRFYRDNRFRTAGFADLRRAFESVSERDLGAFFEQWTTRTGAPALAIEAVSLTPIETGYRVSGRIRQTQNTEPFALLIPLVVQIREREAMEAQVEMRGRSADFSLDVPAEPLGVALDPRFDLFRVLAPGESPPTLSSLFGADRGLVLLPASASPALLEAYHSLAQSWSSDAPGWRIATDREFPALPVDQPVWLLGWENRFLAELTERTRSFTLNSERRALGLPEGQFWDPEQSLALVADRGGLPPVGWIATETPEAVAGLARKLPHYGKYSYLIFSGKAPENRLKGQWPTTDSALTVRLEGDAGPFELKPEVPLVRTLD